MMNEGTEHFEFCVSRIPPQTPPAGRIWNLAKRTLAEENGIHIPKTFVSIFRVLCITTLVERGRDIKIITNIEREISFNHLDLARNSFELCPRYTAL